MSQSQSAEGEISKNVSVPSWTLPILPLPFYFLFHTSPPILVLPKIICFFVLNDLILSFFLGFSLQVILSSSSLHLFILILFLFWCFTITNWTLQFQLASSFFCLYSSLANLLLVYSVLSYYTDFSSSSYCCCFWSKCPLAHLYHFSRYLCSHMRK